MIELFLCDVRRQKRNIVNLCEHFGIRHTRAKRANQNGFFISSRKVQSKCPELILGEEMR